MHSIFNYVVITYNNSVSVTFSVDPESPDVPPTEFSGLYITQTEEFGSLAHNIIGAKQ